MDPENQREGNRDKEQVSEKVGKRNRKMRSSKEVQCETEPLLLIGSFIGIQCYLVFDEI